MKYKKKFIILIILCFGFIAGWQFYKWKCHKAMLIVFRRAHPISDQDIFRVRKLCANRPYFYILYYNKLKKASIALKSYNFFTLCPIEVLLKHKNIFSFENPDQIHSILLGLSWQPDYNAELITPDYLIQLGKKSSHKLSPVIVESLLYRYYNKDEYEDKLIGIMDDFESDDVVFDGPYYRIQYIVLRFLYEKGYYTKGELRNMINKDFGFSYKSRLFIENLCIDIEKEPSTKIDGFFVRNEMKNIMKEIELYE
jgi:hypothetical protein